MDPKLWEQKTRAALELSLAEIAWWKSLVACGRVSSQSAATYIKIEEETVRVKRIVLGLTPVQI
jgi:hypothetical protein